MGTDLEEQERGQRNRNGDRGTGMGTEEQEQGHIPLTTLNTVSSVSANLTLVSISWTTDTNSTVKSKRL